MKCQGQHDAINLPHGQNRRTEEIVHLQLTRQRAQQTEGEHGERS